MTTALAQIAGFMDHSARRGLTARQRRLLGLRQWADGEGQQYDGLRPWAEDTDASERCVPRTERIPLVMVDLAGTKTRRLVEALTGEGQWLTVEVTGPQGLVDVVEAAKLRESLEPAVEDFTRGSMCWAWTRPMEGTYLATPIEPEWCHPVFVSQAKGARARSFARDLVKTGAVDAGYLPSDDTLSDGEPDYFFEAPEGAAHDDLAFLRHEWEEDTEEVFGSGSSSADVKIWHRRDYLPDRIIDYAPLRVVSTNHREAEWKPLPSEPHGWGVVPVMWATTAGARAGDTEGRPLLTAAVVSIAQAADYNASGTQDATAYNQSPTLGLLDAKDRLEGVRSERSAGYEQEEVRTGARAVLDLKSSGQHPGKAFLLETTGQAIAASHEQARHLRHLAESATSIQEHDPEKASGVVSGVALERMKAPEVATVKRYQSRIGASVALGIQKLATILAADAATATAEHSATITWPEPVPPSVADYSAAADAWGKARQMVGLSIEDAVRGFATSVGHPNPKALVASALKAEKDLLDDARDPNRGDLPPGDPDPDADE